MGKRVVALLFAFLGVLAGLLLSGFGLIGAIGGTHSAEQFIGSTALFPLGIMLLELGLVVAWLAWRGTASPLVKLPPWWVAAIVFLVAVLAGWGALHSGLWWLFLPFATVAVSAPVAAVGRLGLPWSGARPTVRRLLPPFAWGALVTPLVAILLQLLATLGALAAAAFGFALSGQDNVAVLTQIVRRLQGRTLTDTQTEALIRLVVQQPLVLLIGAFVLVFVGPVTEELGKFGATLLFARTRADQPGRDTTLTVFLIGLAAGLGFAITENIFYAAQAGVSGWLGLIFTRAVTPLMHGTASALFALGWARQRRAPGSWALLRGAALAIGLHGAWNLCAGLLMVALLFAGTGGVAAGVAIVLAVVAILGLLALGATSWLTLLRLRRTLAAEAEEVPPAPGTGNMMPGESPVFISSFAPTVNAPLSRERQGYPAELRHN